MKNHALETFRREAAQFYEQCGQLEFMRNVEKREEAKDALVVLYLLLSCTDSERESAKRTMDMTLMNYSLRCPLVDRMPQPTLG